MREGLHRPRVRFVIGTLLVFGFVATIVELARLTGAHPLTPLGFLASVPGAALAILVLGSFYEWLVHRFVYHARPSFRLVSPIREIHERGHHWHRFPPDRYVENGPVERIPVLPPDPFALCGGSKRRAVAWAAQYALYLTVGIPLAFVPAWWLTKNPLFTASAVGSGLVVSYFFIRVHDVIHYPKNRLMERQGWFQFLDRHHYIHHIDPRSNVNFLLPLCDWLFGTLKLELTATEQRRWPAFEVAKKLTTDEIREPAHDAAAAFD